LFNVGFWATNIRQRAAEVLDTSLEKSQRHTEESDKDHSGKMLEEK
jgi:hypothetical protein